MPLGKFRREVHFTSPSLQCGVLNLLNNIHQRIKSPVSMYSLACASFLMHSPWSCFAYLAFSQLPLLLKSSSSLNVSLSSEVSLLRLGTLAPSLGTFIETFVDLGKTKQFNREGSSDTLNQNYCNHAFCSSMFCR